MLVTLTEFSCFGNWHCESEGCWDTLASFTDLLLTLHTSSRHAFIVQLNLKGKHRGCSTMLSSPVTFLMAVRIVFFGKKQWAVTDNDIYTCQLAEVNIFICSHLKKPNVVCFRKIGTRVNCSVKGRLKKIGMHERKWKKKVLFKSFYPLNWYSSPWNTSAWSTGWFALHAQFCLVLRMLWEPSRTCCVFHLQLCAWNNLRFHQMLVFKSQAAHGK